MRVERLSPADATRYIALRTRMHQTEPWAFDATPDTDYALAPNDVVRILESPRDAILGIGTDTLVAACALNQPTSPKLQHRLTLWGFYVHPDHRARGVGRALLEGAVDAARAWPGVDSISLSVSEKSAAAIRLYERHGFVTWGREPNLVRIGHDTYDELHMLLQL